MVSREEILWAYRFILGREPESESAYLAHQGHQDRATMRRAMMESTEAQMSVGRIVNRPHQAFDYFRPMLVFLHIEKTGGTSLLDALARHEGMRVAPHGLAHLPSLTLGFLNQYDCIGGHFSYQEAVALPRHPKKILTVLRDPVDRLISFYRFHLAHGEEARDNPVVRLAHELSAADFFRHPEIAGSHRTFNTYVHSFAGLPAPDQFGSADAMGEALDRTLEIISSLDAVGITERMPESERLFRETTDIPMAPIAKLNKTDGRGGQDSFRQVAPVALTDELADVIEPLICYDRVVYDYANDLLTLRMRRLTLDMSDMTAPAEQPADVDEQAA